MTDDPDVRVGTADREQALAALSGHLGEGRLTLPEFDERSAVVAAAVTRGQLDTVFTDLPAPSLQPTAARPLDVRAADPVATSDHEHSDGGWDWRKTLLAVTPFVALILFLVVPVSNSWLFFLLVPLMGALVYGGDKPKRKGE